MLCKLGPYTSECLILGCSQPLQVVGRGLGNFNASSVATFNLDNPIFRDVATVPKGGWLAIRFLVTTLLTAPARLSLSHAMFQNPNQSSTLGYTIRDKGLGSRTQGRPKNGWDLTSGLTRHLQANAGAGGSHK